MSHLDVHGTDLLEARPRDLDLFARTCQHDGDSPATLARRLAAVAAFYRCALAEDAIQINPAAQIRRPAVDADLTTTAALTRREANDLLLRAQRHGPRSHALVVLLLSTGVRISEALATRLSDLTADRLTITRKDGAHAVVYLPERTAAALHALTETTGAELTRDDEPERLVFTTVSGKAWYRNDVTRTLRRLATQAQISKPVTPHVLRHTHATLSLELGVPLHHLQDSLGHRNPRTTLRYDRARTRIPFPARLAQHRVIEDNEPF